jgi:hypothetical protein
MPSRLDNHGPSGQGQIAAQSDLNNVIQGCPCSWCSRHGYDPQTVRRTTEYQDPYGNQNLGGGHPISVASAMNGQAQTWSAAPQAPVCCQIFCFLYLAEILLYHSRIRTMSGIYLYLTKWTLSRSRPVRSLIRLKSLIYRSPSVFGVLLGAM